ncbi:AAA family ATPase [Acutalibacter sp. 1XD8-36]|uniref:AAA family ATPase n=1 Tax=Acutalibacter sp. 1XD8-36 TaxID=2320852 RepID=UPI003FA4843B
MLKINQLEIENVKRIRAVKIEPSQNGLTIIGGNNNQGKTSVLDSIAWALGGDRYRPSSATRDGTNIPPRLHIVMSNGLVVERKGKNSDLKVTDPAGNKGGQQLLNEFVSQLALDLPRFMQASDKEKGDTLLQIIGVGDRLSELERQEADTYNRRRAIGQIADQKLKFAKEMTYYPDAPKEPVSISELLTQQQAILAQNGENQRKRQQAAQLTQQCEAMRQQLKELEERYNTLFQDCLIAQQSAKDLQDQSTAELERNIADIEAINVKVRANLDKEKAEMDANDYQNQYAALTAELNKTRQEKAELLNHAPLPLPGLSVEEGALTYDGKRWDSMSGSDQLKVSTAIVRKLNPKCGFVLLDKLEQMDIGTLREFGAWLESEGLQAIATRVSTGGECSIIIEDGYIAGEEKPAETKAAWKEGEF